MTESGLQAACTCGSDDDKHPLNCGVWEYLRRPKSPKRKPLLCRLGMHIDMLGSMYCGRCGNDW